MALRSTRRNVADSDFRPLKPADEAGVPGCSRPMPSYRNVVRCLTITRRICLAQRHYRTCGSGSPGGRWFAFRSLRLLITIVNRNKTRVGCVMFFENTRVACVMILSPTRVACVMFFTRAFGTRSPKSPDSLANSKHNCGAYESPKYSFTKYFEAKGIAWGFGRMVQLVADVRVKSGSGFGYTSLRNCHGTVVDHPMQYVSHAGRLANRAWFRVLAAAFGLYA